MRLVASLVVLLASAPALAQTKPLQATFDDEDGEAPIVSHRARPFSNNVELTLMFTPTVIEKFINHLGGLAGVGLHVNNWFAIEALGGYEYMRESSIIGGDEGVRFRLAGTREPRLTGLLGMSWVALAGVNLAPIYGKLNLFSEVDFNSQIYFILGAGAVGVVKRELATLNDPDSSTFTVATNQGVRVALDAGIGFRLFLVRWMALRVELRDIIYWDMADIKQNGEQTLDLVNNFMGCFGLSFIVN